MSSDVSRRIWLGQTVGAVGLGSIAAAESFADTSRVDGDRDTVAEAARATDVVRDVDVLVCGGGPAGVSAAISAARAGATVQILECHGSLGGVWTSGMLSHVIDSGKPGFNSELISKLEKLLTLETLQSANAGRRSLFLMTIILYPFWS